MRTLVAIALLLGSVLLAAPTPTMAQTTAPLNDPNAASVGFPFRNMSMLKPPAGAKVAVYEFEDMECPLCASDFAVVRSTVARRKLAYIRHDYPLTEIHDWSFNAAVTARYIEDQISPGLAEQFRRDIFANQARIANKDDLAGYTRQWFSAHQKSFPFVLDATGTCRAQVAADRALGDRLGIHGTPCLFVVTQSRWVLVTNVAELDHTIDAALAETAIPAPHHTAKPRVAKAGQPA